MGMDFDFSMLDAMDILDLAIYVEQEAEDNYDQLAAWSKHENPEATAFFTKMAGWEKLHGTQVIEKRREMFGDTPPKYTSNVAWEVEVPDFDKIGETMTLADALQVAYDAETRAREYYEGVMDYISDEETLALVKDLRDAEIKHQKLVKEQMDNLA
jgi:rubrerythrin